jgi:intraflagellar transport protein 140
VDALALCVEHNIPVTENLAEKLTMSKGEGDEATRVHILEKVGESALAQGNYHLATKKFTQAGNKVWYTELKYAAFAFSNEIQLYFIPV